jgi:hypothetical protein
MPAQAGVTWARLAALGETHCEQKDCVRPCCLHQAVADYCKVPGPTSIDETPAACPLRAYPASALQDLRLHEPA